MQHAIFGTLYTPPDVTKIYKLGSGTMIHRTYKLHWKKWLCCRVNKTCSVIRTACWNQVKDSIPSENQSEARTPQSLSLSLPSNLLYRFIGRDWGPGQATYTSRDIQLVHKHFCILQKKRGQLEGNSSDHEKTFLISIYFLLPSSIFPWCCARCWWFWFCTAFNAVVQISRFRGNVGLTGYLQSRYKVAILVNCDYFPHLTEPNIMSYQKI